MKVRTTKTRPPRPRGKRVTANARRANPLRRDPTRTAGIRRRWEAEVRRRFARLKAALYRLVVQEDAFGLAPPPPPFTAFVTHGFFSECERDALGHCVAAGGGGSEGGQKKGGVVGKVMDLLRSVFGRSSTNYQRPMPASVASRTKAVGPDNKPVTVYMGSQRQFSGGLSTRRDTNEVGLFLSEHRGIAGSYTGEGAGGLIAAHLDVRNPLDVTRPLPRGEAERIAAEFAKSPVLAPSAKEILALAHSGEQDPGRWYAAVSGSEASQKFNGSPKQFQSAYLKVMGRLGYDAIKHEDYDLPVPHSDGTTRYATNWQVFSPKQVWGVRASGAVGNARWSITPSAGGLVVNEWAAPAGNARFAFQTSPQQLQAFKAWLASQVDSDVIGRNDDALWRKYVEEGFRQGASRAFADVRKPAAQAAKEEGAAFYEGGKEEFLRSAFAAPVAVEKVQLLASRTLNELEGVTDQMATAMVRTLADGLVRGSSPREIAADLSDDVGIAKDRSLTIARTELARSHSEGQLVALEGLGVEQLGVMVEWTVADDPCPVCADLAGKVFPIEEARGLLPQHPNCRCAWIPAGVGEEKSATDAAVTNARRVCAPPSAAPSCDCTPALLSFSRFLANCGGQGGTPGPCPSGKKEPSAKLSRFLRPGARVGESKQSKPPPKAEAKPAAPAGATPAPSSREAVTHLAGKVAELDRASGGFNLVHLGDLRAAHPEWSRQEFDSVLQRARREGKVTLSAAEGRHGLTARDQDAAVHEQGSGGTRRTLLFASVRR